MLNGVGILRVSQKAQITLKDLNGIAHHLNGIAWKISFLDLVSFSTHTQDITLQSENQIKAQSKLLIKHKIITMGWLINFQTS